LQLPKTRAQTEHVFMFYPIVLRDAGFTRADLIRHLEERGIETRYLLPLINQPAYRKLFGNLDALYPVAARLNRDAFYIGSHPDISDADLKRIGSAFREFFSQSR
jgi:dTDP-4-amino-4,6-dideoxygalactose transaminase